MLADMAQAADAAVARHQLRPKQQQGQEQEAEKGPQEGASGAGAATGATAGGADLAAAGQQLRMTGVYMGCMENKVGAMPSGGYTGLLHCEG